MQRFSAIVQVAVNVFGFLGSLKQLLPTVTWDVIEKIWLYSEQSWDVYQSVVSFCHDVQDQDCQYLKKVVKESFIQTYVGFSILLRLIYGYVSTAVQDEQQVDLS